MIINEFGEIGLDHLLVEKVDEGMVLLSAGCLCCTVRGDLIATLEDLLRKRDNGRILPFRRVVIETTGLADPAPILHAVLYHPYLSHALRGRGRGDGGRCGQRRRDPRRASRRRVKQAAVAERIVARQDRSRGGPGRPRAPAREAAPAQSRRRDPGRGCARPKPSSPAASSTSTARSPTWPNG